MILLLGLLLLLLAGFLGVALALPAVEVLDDVIITHGRRHWRAAPAAGRQRRGDSGDDSGDKRKMEETEKMETARKRTKNQSSIPNYESN